MNKWIRRITRAAIMLAAVCLCGLEAFAADKEEEAEYYKEFSYGTGFSLSGLYHTETMYFEIPDYWVCETARAQVEYSLSQLLTEDIPATLTFLVNDRQIYTIDLDYEDGKNQVCEIEIPLELLEEGYNTFSIMGYARIYDEEGCLDDFSNANWVYVDEDSFLEVGYHVDADGIRIADWPYPFISTMDEKGAEVQILVSDEEEEKELEAALLLRTALGDETFGEDKIRLSSVSNMEDRDYSVLISLADNLPQEYREYLSEEWLKTDAQTQALVRYVAADGGQTQLLIVSEDGDCLMEAAKMLVDEDRVSQEKTGEAFVNAESSALLQTDVERKSTFTLEELAGGGVSFTGPFHQTVTISFPYTGGQILSSSGSGTLYFRYSDNLDFDRSLITVYLGDVPVASKYLQEEKASGDTLAFFVPDDLAGTSVATLTVAFDLEVEELYCTTINEEMPWAYLTEDSYFYLPSGTSGELSFSVRPYPFEQDSMYHHVLVILPDEPTETELQLAGQVVSLYGKNINPYGELEVVKASDFSASEEERNIIVIGTFLDNMVVEELNEVLSFSYEEDGSAFASNATLILSEAYAQDIGVMQLLRSPYNENSAILAVTGTDESSLRNVSAFLEKEENIWKLRKDAVLIDSTQEIKSYEMLSASEQSGAVTVKEFVTENRDTLVFTVVASSAMLILFLAVIIILIRMYGRSRE